MSKAHSKDKRREPGRRQEGTEIQPRFQHLIAIGVLFASLLVFFSSVVFDGETYLASDTIASHSWDTLLSDAKAAGEFPLWNPYIFCGMPGFASLTFHGSRMYDLVGTVWSWVTAIVSTAFLHPDLGSWFVYYLVLGIGVYLLARSLVHNWVLALLAALGVLYASYTIILVPSGHMTKIAVLAWFPYAFLLFLRVRDSFRWFDVLALVVVLHLLISPGHVQFIFYIYLTFGLLILFYAVRALRKMDPWKPLVRTTAVLAAATVVAVLMGADQYFSVLEYNPSSMRGSGPLVVQQGSGESGRGSGLDYDYATSWSYPPGELMAFVVPTWAGFGTYTYKGPQTQGAAQRFNSYFGPQPFTEAPYYSGVLILVLAGFGFWSRRKETLVQMMGATIVLAALLSFGREFPVLYDPMFAYFPFFNKFRIPAMILVLVQFFLPLLAAYGAHTLLFRRDHGMTDADRRRWSIAMMVSGGLALLMFVAKGIPKAIYETFVPPSSVTAVFTAKGYHPQVAAALQTIVSDVVASEFAIAAAIVFSLCLIVVLVSRGNLTARTAAILLVVVSVADLWRVSGKPIESHPQSVQDVFVAPPYIPTLQADSSLFRVLRLQNGTPPFDNSLAYWRISSAFGYQGAKMRRYQDIVDNAGIVNPSVWRMMNVKYLITDRPDSSSLLTQVFRAPDMFVYRFTDAVPRAFFPASYEIATDRDIMTTLRDPSYDPRMQVYGPEELPVAVEAPGDGAAITGMSEGINSFSARVTATGNNLVVVSDSYYEHGWRAYLDGKEIPIHRINYHFRGVLVTEGSHELRMEFRPQSYVLGTAVTLGMNILILVGLAFQGALQAGYLARWRRKDAVNSDRHEAGPAGSE